MGEAGPLGEVVRAFGLGELRGGTEAARGAMGRVFRVETSAGVWAVKELFPHEHGDEEASGHEHNEATELELLRHAVAPTDTEPVIAGEEI